MKGNNDVFMNVDEAATFIRLSKHSIYQMTRRCEIPFSKPSGGKLVFSKQALERWIKSKECKRRK